jgi:hypothetical protein
LHLTIRNKAKELAECLVKVVAKYDLPYKDGKNLFREMKAWGWKKEDWIKNKL